MEIAGEQIAFRPFFPVFHYKQIPEEMTQTDDYRIEYRESDGKPVGETEFHVMALVHLYQSLKHFFRNHPDVCTIADMLLYYEKGNTRAFKVPDVMVIKGVDKYPRRIFKLWEEKAVPCVIFEITSKSTVAEDIAKSLLYASLGVREYVLFDPMREYIEDGLLGYRLDGMTYRPIAQDEEGNLFSKELGLILKQEGHLLRLYDPDTGRPVPSLDEAVLKAEDESRKATRLAAKLREMGIDPESL